MIIFTQERLFEMICYSYLYFAEYEEYSDNWIKGFFDISDAELELIAKLAKKLKKEKTK